jgi:glycosyltransferase involved in cell wall biosynthesis
MPGADRSIKGIDLLWDILRKLANDYHHRISGVVLGQAEPVNPPNIGLPLNWLGSIKDDRLLPLVYSAVDAAVVPSRVDNFPQMGSEAQACGCPVVAFSVCGLGDVIQDGVSGLLVPPFDTAAFAGALRTLLEDPVRARAQGAAARERAVRLWNYPAVARCYGELYGALLEEGMGR